MKLSSLPEWRNLLICGFTMFMSRVCVSILLPSLFPFLRSLGASEGFYGMTVSFFNLFQIISSPFFGFLAQKRNPKEVLLVSLFIEICGHALYATADNKFVVLAGRILAGLGLGNEAVINSYITEVTPAAQRSTVLGAMQMAIALAFAAGPAIGIPLSQADFKIGSLKINELTSAGYMCCLVSTFNFILVMFFNSSTRVRTENDQFESSDDDDTITHDSRATPGEIDVDHNSDDDTDDTMPRLVPVGRNQLAGGDDNASGDDTAGVEVPLLNDNNSQRLFYISPLFRQSLPKLLPFMISAFLLTTCSAVYELVTTPVTIKLYDFDVLTNAGLWAVVGCTSATALASLNFCSKTGWSDYTFYLMASCGLVVSFGLMFSIEESDLELWRFIMGTLCVAICYPVSMTFLTSVFSQVIGPENAGTLLGFLLAAGALAKLISPFWASELPIGVTFTTTCLLLLINVIVIVVMRKKALRHL